MKFGKDNIELKEYKEEIGDFNIFGLINKQLLVMSHTAGTTIAKN